MITLLNNLSLVCQDSDGSENITKIMFKKIHLGSRTYIDINEVCHIKYVLSILTSLRPPLILNSYFFLLKFLVSVFKEQNI